MSNSLKKFLVFSLWHSNGNKTLQTHQLHYFNITLNRSILIDTVICGYTSECPLSHMLLSVSTNTLTVSLCPLEFSGAANWRCWLLKTLQEKPRKTHSRFIIRIDQMLGNWIITCDRICRCVSLLPVGKNSGEFLLAGVCRFANKVWMKTGPMHILKHRCIQLRCQC